MSPSDRELVVILCGQAQRGLAMTEEQQKFLNTMRKQYPDEYRSAHTEAWNDNAAAIGSTRRKP